MRDDRTGQSYVYKQPETEEEIAAVMEGVDGCPTHGVGADGDQYDWDSAPIIDWTAALRRFDYDVTFEITLPIIPYAETLEEERVEMERWRAENKTSLWGKLFGRE